jgi:NDP-sugar pyrophosphorylase family protein
VTGFILAAGFGTRLKPLTDHIPKALVSACGVPLLKRSFDFLTTNGFPRIGVNFHHHPGQIESFIREQGLACSLFHESGTIRGTGGALYFAKDFLAQDDYFCVANADIIADINLAALFASFKGLNCSAGLVSVPAKQGAIWYDTTTGNYGGANSEQATAPSSCREGRTYADFLGIAFYKKEFLDVLNARDFSVLPVWKRAQEKGLDVKIVEAGTAYWNDLGTPAKLAGFHFDVLDGACPCTVPPDIMVDRREKKAYPTSLPQSSAEKLGPYSWVECEAIPNSVAIFRSVVFRGASVPENSTICNSIATPYGVISFGA